MSEGEARVSVLFFARFRDLAGESGREMVVPPGTRVEDLLRRLRADGVALPEGAAVAVNRSYASPDTPVSDGDEVAIVPPVAGG